MKIEPQEAGEGYEFVNEIVGGVIPKEYIPAVDKGIQEQMQNGVIAGYPVVDVKVTLFDGSFHEVDSSEMAFKIAGSMGFKQGAAKAKPVLLEPIMKVEVVTPEDYMGDFMGDLNRRRGMLQGMDESPAGRVIVAEVPLAEMFGYSTSCLLGPLLDFRLSPYFDFNRRKGMAKEKFDVTNLMLMWVLLVM